MARERPTSAWLAGVLVTLLLTTAWPGGATSHATPEIRTLGPETGSFFVHEALSPACSRAAADHAGAPVSYPFLYATNVAEDDCATTTHTGAKGKQVQSTTERLEVHLLFDSDAPVQFVEGAPITATIWVWSERAGTVSPMVSIQASSWERTTDHGEQVDPTEIRLAPDGLVWERFDVTLGPAPAAIGPDGVILGVRLGNSGTEVRQISAIHSGIGVTPGHKSVLHLPLDEQDGDVDPLPEWPTRLDAARFRPGVPHVTEGAQCTTNFVFRDRGTDRLYMGTAAHCVDNVGEGGKTGIKALDGGKGIVATVAYSSWDSGPAGDFALLEIPKDREQEVHPAMLHFGGPTHLADMGDAITTRKVITYGNSGLRSGPNQLDAHEGYITFTSAWFTDVYTVTPGIYGDSGSGLMTANGGALGALSTIHFAPFAGQNSYSNIPPAIAWLNANGWDLELQTWRLLDSGELPAPWS